MGTRMRRSAAVALGATLVGLCPAGCAPSGLVERAPTQTRTTAEWSPDPSETDCEASLPRVELPGRNTTKRRVAEIQKVVGADVDGTYGIDTTARVMRWQRCHGLEADGIWGATSDAEAFAEADAAAAAIAEAEAEREREAKRWHCEDDTSFDKNPYNDNYCANEFDAVLVSDSEAVRLDPHYVPGTSGHWWYNDQ